MGLYINLASAVLSNFLNTSLEGVGGRGRECVLKCMVWPKPHTCYAVDILE